MTALDPTMDAQARLLYRYGGDPSLAMLSMLRELGYRGSTFMNPFMTSMLDAAPGLKNAFILQQALGGGMTPEGGVETGAASAQAFADFLRSTLAGGNVMGALQQGRQNLVPAMQLLQNRDVLSGAEGQNPYWDALDAALQEGGGGGALSILSSLANPFMPTQMSRAVDTSLKRALTSALYQYSEAPGSFGNEGRSIGNLLFPGLQARPTPAATASSVTVPAPPTTATPPPEPVAGADRYGGVAQDMNQALAEAAKPQGVAGARITTPQPEGVAAGSVYGQPETASLNPLERLSRWGNPTAAQQGIIDMLREQQRRLFSNTKG